MVEVMGKGPLSSLPPSSKREGGRSHIRPNLHGWESIASRLFDHHGSRDGSWKSPRRSLFKPSWRLLGMVGPFAIAGGWRRLFPILGLLLLLLCNRVTTGQKSISSHLQTTISSLAFLASTPEESTDSTFTCSAVGASVRCSLTDVCTARP